MILAIDGGELLADIGAGEYTKEYFGGGRSNILCISSYGHNVPLINGQGQREGSEFKAADCKFSDDGKFASMDISSAYADENLISLVREFTFNDRINQILLRDKFVFQNKNNTLEEHFITRFEPLLELGKVLLKTEKGLAGTIEYDIAFIKASVEIQKHMSHEGKAENIYIIVLKVQELYEELTLDFIISLQ